MEHLRFLFSSWYGQVWPNLAANVIWVVPTVIWHSKRTRAKIAQVMDIHHEQITNTIMEVVPGAQAPGTETGTDSPPAGLR